MVTGGSSGIGESLVQLLRADGRTVYLLDRRSPSTHDAFFIQVDLADHDDLAAAAASIDQPISGLANIAGIPGADSPTSVIAVNLVAPIMLTRMLMPQMTSGASVVNVSSISSARGNLSAEAIRELVEFDDPTNYLRWLTKHPISSTEAYRVSKRAIAEWTEASAPLHLAEGIRLNCVSPGPVETPALPHFRASMGPHAIDRALTDLGRHASARDVADVIRFLLGPQSVWINGQNIVVDGGLLSLRRSQARSRKG